MLKNSIVFSLIFISFIAGCGDNGNKPSSDENGNKPSSDENGNKPSSETKTLREQASEKSESKNIVKNCPLELPNDLRNFVTSMRDLGNDLNKYEGRWPLFMSQEEKDDIRSLFKRGISECKELIATYEDKLPCINESTGKFLAKSDLNQIRKRCDDFRKKVRDLERKL